MSDQPTPKERIEQIAQDARLLTRASRRGYAKTRAMVSAVPMQQVDFVETLDACIQAALDAEEITVGRAVEMFNRLEHYLDCLGKYYARNREMGKRLDELDKEIQTND